MLGWQDPWSACRSWGLQQSYKYGKGGWREKLCYQLEIGIENGKAAIGDLIQKSGCYKRIHSEKSMERSRFIISLPVSQAGVAYKLS